MQKLLLIIGALFLMPLLSYAQSNNSFEINGKIIASETFCIIEAKDISIPDTNANHLQKYGDSGDWGYSTISFTNCAIAMQGGKESSTINMNIPMDIISHPDYWQSSNTPINNDLGIELVIDETHVGTMGIDIPPKDIKNNSAVYATKARLVRINNGEIKPGDSISVTIKYGVSYK